MPASQLKRLKASLREHGVTGPSPSKKQKRSQKDAGKKDASQRFHHNFAIQQIRESLNPFDIKAPNGGRPEKFASVSQTSTRAGHYKEILHRPGTSKSVGEEMRRATLLPEMRRRNKVGGVVDRRIGEGDTDMTPEERAAVRFAKEKERKRKGSTLFDLEANDDEAGYTFTHGGRNVDELAADDFDDEDMEDRSADDLDHEDLLRLKEPRNGEAGTDVLDATELEETNVQPERKRSKKEVMEEVIAKSKLHKYERQKAKENDDELREELDSGMSDILALLKSVDRPSLSPAVFEPAATNFGHTINPDRQRLLDGSDRRAVDREYDSRLKQLAQDTRAKPSDRTKTAEEKAADDAKRLQVLEQRRLKRMQGEVSDEDREDDLDIHAANGNSLSLEGNVIDEAADFGFKPLAATIKQHDGKLVLDDEDAFFIDEDLIASDSEGDLSGLESTSDNDDEDNAPIVENVGIVQDDELEFLQAILGDDVPAMENDGNAVTCLEASASNESGLQFVYPCPRTHAELLAVIGNLSPGQVIPVVRRIRALYHPSLSASNKEAMSDFSRVLVHHLAHVAKERHSLPLAEQIIRHLHSLSRTYSTQVADTFRQYLSAIRERDQLMPKDLLIFSAIGTIYPTSDHWHQVVTPAISIMARWLNLNTPVANTHPDARVSEIGACLLNICLIYLSRSKRYLPDAVRFVFMVLLSAANGHPAAKLTHHIENLLTMADLWHGTSAFAQIFSPFLPLLKALQFRKQHSRLAALLAQAHSRTRPLELHYHRPLPIRTSIPKFEETFDPGKHYDPDKERSDAKKLQREYKRERKGALRELRKDANFIAREQLREKRIRDEEYEKKYRRLVAEVQNEEGAAAKEYEKEKDRRQRKR